MTKDIPASGPQYDPPPPLTDDGNPVRSIRVAYDTAEGEKVREIPGDDWTLAHNDDGESVLRVKVGGRIRTDVNFPWQRVLWVERSKWRALGDS